MGQKHILLRFYDGGELADYKVVETVTEDELTAEFKQFSADCGQGNIGVRTGVISEDNLVDLVRDAITGGDEE